MPELSREVVVAETDFSRRLSPIANDIAVPVGADSYRVSIPLDGFPVTKESVIECRVSVSQDAGKTFVEGAGIGVDGGGGFDMDMRTRQPIPLTEAGCGQSLANPENPDRVLRVFFTPLKDCRTKVDVSFGGKV